MPTEVEIWQLDQAVNTRGVCVDVDLARAAVAAAIEAKRHSDKAVTEQTGGAATTTGQRDKLLAHILTEYGVTLPDLTASTLERRLEDAALPEPLRDLLKLRLSGSKSSVSKYARVVESAAADGRLHGLLQYCGASRTGRWAGRIIQPHNLPLPTLKPDEIEAGIAATKAGVVDLLVPDVLAMLSSALRGLIIAGPGYKLVVSDLANIESRVLPWLAGEQWKLDAWRAYDAGTGPDLYRLIYSRAFYKALELVGADDRQLGKVMELALGFQGAVGAFSSMAAAFGVELPEAQVLAVVQAWRQANPAIVNYWYALERAAMACADNGGEYEVGQGAAQVVIDRKGTWLRIRLPSGRFLSYPAAHVIDGARGPKLSYMGMNQYSREWERLSTYGGKLAENITQAVARDVLAWAMPRVEAAGFRIVLTVHDEIITEVPTGINWDVRTAAELSAILARGEDWTEGLPLAAAGFECQRYRKG